MALSQSEIVAREVNLFDLFKEQDRYFVKHLKCLCRIRLTKKNIENFKRERKKHKYGQYYICKIFLLFLITLSKSYMKFMSLFFV